MKLRLAVFLEISTVCLVAGTVVVGRPGPLDGINGEALEQVIIVIELSGA